MENQSPDGDHLKFETRVLDDRHGTIHVPVCDLHGDGRKDFIAVISQEHETIVAFLNDGKGHFEERTIWTAPHPAYGSSGIQVVDMNRDGNPDVLYTNGDVLDKPYLLKPYHSVQWLENPGPGKFPWVHHALTPMYGVHRAVAADLCGDPKLLDVAAVCFLPAAATREEGFPDRETLKRIRSSSCNRRRPAGSAAYTGDDDLRPRHLRRRRRVRDGAQRHRSGEFQPTQSGAGDHDLEEPRQGAGRRDAEKEGVTALSREEK